MESEAWLRPEKLSEEVLLELNEKGYVVLEHALSEHMCHELRLEMDRLLEKERAPRQA